MRVNASCQRHLLSEVRVIKKQASCQRHFLSEVKVISAAPPVRKEKAEENELLTADKGVLVPDSLFLSISVGLVRLG